MTLAVAASLTALPCTVVIPGAQSVVPNCEAVLLYELVFTGAEYETSRLTC